MISALGHQCTTTLCFLNNLVCLSHHYCGTPCPWWIKCWPVLHDAELSILLTIMLARPVVPKLVNSNQFLITYRLQCTMIYESVFALKMHYAEKVALLVRCQGGQVRWQGGLQGKHAWNALNWTIFFPIKWKSNYYYLKRSAVQGWERVIYTISVRRPQPHNTNL